jgi:3-phytase
MYLSRFSPVDMSNITEAFQPLRNASLYVLSGLTTVIVTSNTAQAATIAGIDFLGQQTFPTNTIYQGTEVGGLSGITYDPSRNVYYSISDDRSENNPARFYTLTIDLNQGNLGQVNFTNVTTLLNENSQPFPSLSLDPEGIALTNNRTVFISSEGEVNPSAGRITNPFVKEFSLTGRQLNTLPVPQKFLPASTGTDEFVRGVRNNLGFESLTIAPNQQYLFTATENALVQDGPTATVDSGSPSRILKYNLATEQPVQEFLYLTDPVAAAPNPTGSFSTNGLVDLLALDSNTLLSLERSFSVGVGNAIKLYEVSLAGAEDISNINSLQDVNISNIQPAQKELLLDFSELGIPLDNIEGLTFGPTLADGRRSLIVVSDNNFSPTQFTQILAFAVSTEPSRSVPEPSAMAGLALLVVVGVGAKRGSRRSAN